MGFEVFTVKRGGTKTPPGHASISKGGQLVLNTFDIARLGITGNQITLLIDRETKRMGFRKPRLNDVSLTLHWSKSKTSAAFSAKGILLALGIPPEKWKSRYLVHCKDDLLVIEVLDAKGMRNLKAG